VSIDGHGPLGGTTEDVLCSPPWSAPGNRGRSSAIPTRPCRSGPGPEGLGTARFLRHSNGRNAEAPSAREWRRWCSSTPYPPPQPPSRPVGGSHCLGYHQLGRAGWWVAGAQGPPEGPIARARNAGADRGGATGGPGSPRVRGPVFLAKGP
jgi:hypothetical protein